MENTETKRVHLFNCDSLFNLDSVKSLFTSAESKLNFNIKIEKHHFKLSEMSEMSDSKVPGLHMDVAVFVVHANESRLSINEENAGIGYAKIYRALVQATGKSLYYKLVYDTCFVYFYQQNDMSKCFNLILENVPKLLSICENLLDTRILYYFAFDREMAC